MRNGFCLFSVAFNDFIDKSGAPHIFHSRYEVNAIFQTQILIAVILYCRNIGNKLHHYVERLSLRISIIQIFSDLRDQSFDRIIIDNKLH